MNPKSNAEGLENLDDFQLPSKKARIEVNKKVTEGFPFNRNASTSLECKCSHIEDQEEAIKSWQEEQLKAALIDNVLNELRAAGESEYFLQKYSFLKNQMKKFDKQGVDCAVEFYGFRSRPTGEPSSHDERCQFFLPTTNPLAPKSDSEFLECALTVTIINKGLCTCRKRFARLTGLSYL